MDEKIIVDLLKLYSNDDKEIRKKDFNRYTDKIRGQEQYRILDNLKEKGYKLVDETRINKEDIRKRHQELSNEKLIYLYRLGYQEFLDDLVKKNSQLIYRLIDKSLVNKSPLMEREDLYIEGTIGLIKAVEKFDFSFKTPFTLYAGYWIRQSINRAIMDQGSIIRIPVHIREDMDYIEKNLEGLNIDLAKDYEKLLENTKFSKDKIKSLIYYIEELDRPISLHQKVGVEYRLELIEFLSTDDTSTYQKVEDRILKEDINHSLNILDKREKLIIIKRFGLNGEDSHTLEELGGILNLTRERIRQLEKKALEDLSKNHDLIIYIN